MATGDYRVDPPLRRLQYVVTGTGRCGTVYYARLLTALGFPCGHESVFNYQDLEVAKARLEGVLPLTLSGCSQTRWERGQETYLGPYVDKDNIVAESSYMAAPHLGHQYLLGAKIIHVVRHPVRVVNSFVNYLHYFYEPSACKPPNPFYEAFIYRHVPSVRSAVTPYERGALFYVLWNEMIEQHETLCRVRAEDGPAPLMEAMGVDGPAPFDDREVNTFAVPGRRFSLEHLPRGEIRDRFVAMGRRYGYRMSSEYMLL